MIERIYQHAQEVREALPNESWANHTYTLAVRILTSTFGYDWVEKHVLASDDRSPGCVALKIRGRNFPGGAVFLSLDGPVQPAHRIGRQPT